MSDLNSDKEPLIGFSQPGKLSQAELINGGGGGGAGESQKIYDEKSPALPNPVFPSKQPRGYGTLSQPPPVVQQNQNLVYTWENIDIFGEASQQSKSCLSILKSCTPCTKTPVLRKHLLKNVYGLAKGGEVTAILGSSGAGKTTLLNALAYRSPTGIQVSSNAIRAINGIPVTATELRARCAYVQQDDLFIGSLTPNEHLIFQAMLRIPKSVPYKQKLERVNEVINELSLVKCRNTIIGVPGRMKGLSGGERKRLSFASEALTDPPLLLCDEPTSGLDSFIAQNVIQVLRNLAGKGKTVILTIHQPSSELFHLFDKLVFMAEGRTAFFGTPDEAKNFFSGVGFDCPMNYNPADFYIQILAIDPNDEQESRNQIQRICDSFATDKLSDNMLERIQSMKKENRDIDSVAKGIARYRSDWCTQLRAIMWRSWISTIKEPLLIKVRLIQTVMIAVLIGLIFYKQEMNQEGVMNINGALFLFLTNMTFQNVFSVMNVFCGELPVFLRESRSQLYRTDTFFLGKTIAELPLFMLVPFLFTAITYPMIGLLPGVDHFLMAVAIVTLIANTATSFGYMISCASRTTAMALALGPPIIIPFLLFGGFFLNAASVPFYFEWLSYLSWFRYGNEALLINQWASVGEGVIECTRSNQTCPSSGHVILETLNFNEVYLIRDIFALIGLIVAFRLLAFIALYVRSRSKE